MIKQKQKFRHKPEQGTIGDCHRTCIACLLNMDRDSVPHFAEMSWPNTNWDHLVDEWLQQFGLCQTAFAIGTESGNVQEALDWMKEANPYLSHYMLTGISWNNLPHVVIAGNGEIVWDPSLDDSGIVAPQNGWYWITVLARR